MAGRIVVVSASVGAGHDGVARELAHRLRDAGFTVDCHDFMELWPPGRLLRASYARQLRLAPRSWGWLLAALARYRLITRLAVVWASIVGSRRLLAALGEQPVLVISVYPLASQALGRLRRLGRLAAPVITFLTDMSVHPLWVAAGVDVHLALHEVAAAEAVALGARGVRVTGPVVAPAFRPAADNAERAAARRLFRIPANAPLALVVAGSWGVGEIEAAAADIAAAGLAMPVVACGHNEGLRFRIAESGTGIAIGWTDAMPDLIRACDVVVQNAGGLSSLEALACEVPVLTYRCLPGHGFTNAAALDRAGWARWVHDAEALPTALKWALTEPPDHTAARRTDPADVIAELARRGR